MKFLDSLWGGQQFKKKIFVILLTFAVVMGAFAGLDMDARASELCIFTADQSGKISCNYDYTNLIISAELDTTFAIQFETPKWLKQVDGKIDISFKYKNGDKEAVKIENNRLKSTEGFSFNEYLNWLQIDNIDKTPYRDTISNPKWKLSVTCNYDANDKKLKWNIVAELYNGSDPLSEPIRETANNTGGTGDTPANHTHSFEWTVTKEPTKTEDGLEEYRCRGCGAVEASQPISMYMFRVKELYGLVKDVPKGGAVAYDSGNLATISDYVLAKMAERTDVTTVISFEYQNQAYKMTIPAGADFTGLLADEEYFYGYFFFANAVGAKIEAL